jgi:hypothetical protein
MKRTAIKPTKQAQNSFSNTANSTHKLNVNTNVQRGGIRL